MKYFFQRGKENGRQICGFIAPIDWEQQIKLSQTKTISSLWVVC